MFSPRDQDAVLSALGDKFLAAQLAAVNGAREDIAWLQTERPGWFPNMAQRTLANLIHDRMWDRMSTILDGESGVELVDREPLRQIHVGVNLQIRLKRHSLDDLIATYETPGALAFWAQGAATLPGLEEVSLAAGYHWITDERRIGPAVITYREGKNNPIWSVELNDSGGDASGSAPVSWKPIDLPDLPSIGRALDDDKEEGGASS